MIAPSRTCTLLFKVAIIFPNSIHDWNYRNVIVEDKPSVSHLRMVMARIIGGIMPRVRHTEINEYEASGLPDIDEITTGPVWEAMEVVKNRANKNSL